MLRTLHSSLIFSICIVVTLQVTSAQNDAEEDILELLNEIKNEEHKSLQHLREELLWQHPFSNQLIGTGLISNPNPIKRQNAQHMIWNKLAKARAGSESISSLLKSGKRSTWGMSPFDNTLYRYPSNEEPSTVDSNIKNAKRVDSQHQLWRMVGDAMQGNDKLSSIAETGKRAPVAKRVDSQHQLWTMVGDAMQGNDRLSSLAATGKRAPVAKRVDSQHQLWAILGDAMQGNDRLSSLAATGKRAPVVKRPDAQQMIWAKMGSLLQNNDRLESLAATGKRATLGTNVKGQHMFFNTIGDLYHDPNVWTSLKTNGNGDSTSPGQPSRLDETDFVEDILRQEEEF